MQDARPLTPLEEGLAAARTGDHARANAIVRALLARDPNDVHALQLAGFVAFREGRTAEALRAFLRANQAAPGQPAILYWIGLLLKDRGDFEQARRVFEDALRINPDHAEGWCQLGETQFLLGRLADADAAFERALAAEPSASMVLARAARHSEKRHDLSRARALAEAALKADPQNEIAAIALVEIDVRERRFEDAVARAEPLLARDSRNLRNQARLNHLAATSLDRLGDYREAFVRYERANRLQKELDSGQGSAPSTLLTENLDRLIGFLRAVDISGWRAPKPAGPAPVFLLGFVRSGTTWLDQILSSHPDIVVMEEEDNFADAWRELLVSDAGLAKLAAMPAEDVGRLRAAYWTRAAGKISEADRTKTVVDKLPLNSVHLPLIWRLFPEARIIFALRDPRDAVFSAFQQHFQINTGMAHFLDIRSAAEFYDRVMTIAALTRAQAAFDIREIRYETVVGDFESEIRGLIAFLGLPWSDAVLDYQATAKERAIRTPSAPQVIEKPYATSIGKWRRYREGMAPALPVLAPWAERFGYEAQ